MESLTLTEHCVSYFLHSVLIAKISISAHQAGRKKILFACFPFTFWKQGLGSETVVWVQLQFESRIMLSSLNSSGFSDVFTQNHRIAGVGRDLKWSPSPTPYNRSRRWASRQVLNISIEEDSKGLFCISPVISSLALPLLAIHVGKTPQLRFALHFSAI